MKYYFLALGTVVVVCVGCAMDGQQLTDKGEYHAPPAAMMQHPGPMVDGPGPGVIGMMAPGPQMPAAVMTTQVRFVGPDGMHIGWQAGPNAYAENQMVAPGSYNFRQGAMYRLKMTNIPGREDLALYPTLQVYPSQPNTEAYLTHVKVPVQLTNEDLDQIESNNFVTKVIYLPDAKFQELAIANVETLVSTRLDPGIDPVQEADKRGSIMAVLRIGNKDEEMPAGAVTAGVDGDIDQVNHAQADGEQGAFVPPMPIGPAGNYQPPIPGSIMVAGSGYPGQPAGYPVAGMNMPAYGQPMTGTPIGLVGPPHIPLGGKASLKSHTVVNRSKNNLPDPVQDMRIDVIHEPGYSLPKPASYIQYKETHPVFSPGELSYPANQGGGAYYP